jgi:hypothetical protein
MIQAEKLNSWSDEEIERNWRSSLPRFTDSFLVETFAESILELDDKLLDLQDQASKIITIVLEVGRPYFGKSDPDSMFVQQFIKHWYISDLISLENDIRFIERLQKRLKRPDRKAPAIISDKAVELARMVPITNLADQYVQKLHRQGKNYFGCCPFHADSSPSLVLYTDSNRFYCFGCHVHGDVITFAQKILGLDFRTTINHLINL